MVATLGRRSFSFGSRTSVRAARVSRPRRHAPPASAFAAALALVLVRLPVAGAFDDNLQCTDIGRASEFNLSPCDFAMQ